MYAYCSGDPINEIDVSGNKSISLKDVWNQICEGAKTAYDWINTGVGSLNVNMAKTGSAVVAVTSAILRGDGKNVVDDLFNGALNPLNQNEDVAINSKVLGFYKGELIVRHSVPNTTSCQIFGVIYLNSNINTKSSKYETLNHEWGHGVQERILGTKKYTTNIAVPSLLAFGYDSLFGMSDQDYYSLPSERTADYFGNVNRTFPNGQSYHSGSLVWSLASMAVGPIAYIGYLIFN